MFKFGLTQFGMPVDKKINISNVSFHYNDVAVLDKVSFGISNEIACVLAPTGAGKTTLLNLVSGLLQPKKGTITIGGLKPSEAVANKKIGFSFQDSTLLEWKNVFDNVLLPLQIGVKKNITEQEEKLASELIELVGLSDYKNKKCSELSGGMKQRVGLARALITNPDIILFDEPFNKLDFITKTNLLIEFRSILKEKKVSCIIVTHNVEDAVFIGDKVLIFRKNPLSLKEEVKIDLGKRNKETLNSLDFLNTVSKVKESIL